MRCTTRLYRRAFFVFLAATALAIYGANCSAALAADDAAKTPADEVVFSRDVAPIFLKHCAACHGAKGPKGEFQLDSYQHLLKTGSSGEPSIVPAKVDEGELIRLITSPDVAERMPKDGDPLAREQVTAIRRWIAAGAKFDGADPAVALTSIVPPPVHPLAPEKYPRPIPITAVALNPVADEVAVAGYHEITIWSTESGTLLRRIPGIAERTLGLAYSPDGKQLAAASGNPGQLGEVKLLDPASGAMMHSVARMTDMATCVAFDPAGERLACGGLDRTVRICRASDGSQLQLIEEHADGIAALAWSPDGKQLATASRDKTCKVANAADGQVIATFHAHEEPVYAIAFVAEGKQIASAGRDQHLRVWSIKEHETKQEHQSKIGSDVFQLIAGKTQLIGCGLTRSVQFFDLQEAKVSRTLDKQDDQLFSMALRDDVKQLATGSHDGIVAIWNTETGQRELKFTAAPGIEK